MDDWNSHIYVILCFLDQYLRKPNNNNNNNNNKKKKKKKKKKREIESLLIAAQNIAIRNNYIKARTDKIQQNIKCRLCGDRDETINQIISERSKLAQKEYKTRHDWLDQVIHWELCKKLKFNHTIKWYVHKPESVLENETYKLLRDFEIQTNHLILARRQTNNNQQKKKKKKDLQN